MARPQKDGIDYFPLDVNFFIDPDIKSIRMRFGAEGIALYIYLLCEIYREGYFLRMSEDSTYFWAEELKMSEDKVRLVLNFLLKRSLFDNTFFQTDKVLTSTGIQRRFQRAVKERARKNPIKIEGFWLLEKEETEPFIKVNPKKNYSGNNASFSGNNGSNSGINDTKERKENKIKKNKTKSLLIGETPTYELPLAGEGVYIVEPEIVEKYKKIYSTVDIENEFFKMALWLENNPGKRKFENEMGRFINGWINRELANQKSQRPYPAQEKKRTKFHNFNERDNHYEDMIYENIRKRGGAKDEQSNFDGTFDQGSGGQIYAGAGADGHSKVYSGD